jgi:mannose-6-phosphate isomerase
MNPVTPYSEPLVFGPYYQVRVWGGRELETRLGRSLPDAEHPYGEAWEISDRPEAESRVVTGPAALIGKTLGELWRGADPATREALFGPDAPGVGPFPLLCKILDAREKLSLQVHPPESEAAALGGEPKTEMWVVAHAEPGAELIAGVAPETTREAFEAALRDGTAGSLVHRIPVRAGDFLFVPSGRLHAIGAGLLIYEIQQNSDTTYRVFDWNRVGLDGKPRELHLEESLRCIDFGDAAPEIGVAQGSLLVDCGHFRVERHTNSVVSLPKSKAAIVTVVSGRVKVAENGDVFRSGDSFLVPALWAGSKRVVAIEGEATMLLTTWSNTAGRP